VCVSRCAGQRVVARRRAAVRHANALSRHDLRNAVQTRARVGSSLVFEIEEFGAQR